MKEVEPVKFKYHWMHKPYQAIEASMVIPIPLNKNTLVTVSNIPVNLTKKQADKICSVIQAFAK